MDIIPMHLGVAHFPSPAFATEALQAALTDGQTYYGPNEGILELRKAIAQRYFEDEGIPLPAEQVLITHGTKHALYLYLKTLLQPGDEVVTVAPYWFAFPELVRQCGATLNYVHPNPEQEYALPLEALKDKISPATKLLLLTNPGNPTGKVYSAEEMEAVVELLHHYPNQHLMSDEIYDGLVYDQAPQSFLRFEHLRDRITVVNGFSKSYAMSGWRIGYLIAPFALLQKAMELQQNLISGVSPFPQVGAAAALRNRHAIWSSFREELSQKRQKVAAVLNGLPNLSYFLPQAGYYFTLDIKNLLQNKNASSPYLTAEEWGAALKAQAGLEVLPGTNMGMPTGVRMSFALPDDVLESALYQLEAFVS